jgi:predicted nucleic acid-binding OB-fold protein
MDEKLQEMKFAAEKLHGDLLALFKREMHKAIDEDTCEFVAFLNDKVPIQDKQLHELAVLTMDAGVLFGKLDSFKM